MCAVAQGTYRRVSIFHSQNRDSFSKMKANRGGKQEGISVGWWYVTLIPNHSPRAVVLVVHHFVRYLSESINFPLTKSRLMRKNARIC